MKKKIYFALPVIAILVIVAGYLMFGAKARDFSVSDAGIVSFGSRPAANFTISFFNETPNAKIYKIVFWSVDKNIYGLLSIPKTGSAPYTTFILLPANSIPKEEEQKWLGDDLNKKGYAAFSIDQRGIGETESKNAKGSFINEDYDLGLFESGGYPEEYKMFYDALAAFDVMSSGSGILNNVNKTAIYMAGESMGGRVAIIAGSMETKIAGVMGISTGGYGIISHSDYMTQIFINSIDPDNYVKLISPRKLLLLHSKYDQTVSSLVAERTFSYANEPKKLLEDDGSDHGYYRHEKVITLNEGLQWLLS